MGAMEEKSIHFFIEQNHRVESATHTTNQGKITSSTIPMNIPIMYGQ